VKAVSADLAVHWFADLGALLLFVGIFGFVAFAFADVKVGLRPVAETAIPVALFVLGAVLRRRGTPAVGQVLVLLGGALLPVVVIAASSDGASPPPDLTGTTLALVLVVELLFVAAAYAAVAGLVPSSPLRFLVAPVGWLAVAAAGLPLGRSVPTGSNLAGPTAAQWSLVLVAIAATAVVARPRSDRPWAAAMLAACWPGLILATTVTIAAAGTEGWPPVPVTIGAVAAIITLEVLGGRHVVATTWTQTGVALAAALAVSSHWPIGWVATAISLFALAGTQLRRRRAAPQHLDTALVTIGAVAWLVTVGTTGVTPWAVVATSCAWWAWGAWMHRRGPSTTGSIGAVVIWVAPLTAVAGIAVATSVSTGQVVLAAALTTVALTLRLRPKAVDSLVAAWVLAGAAFVTVWLAMTLPPVQIAAHIAAGLIVVTFAVAPRHPVLRSWGAASAATVLAGGLWWRIDGSRTTLALAMCATGCALVALGERRRSSAGAHLSAMGLLFAGSAPVVAGFLSSTPARVTVPAGLTIAGFAGALLAVAVIEELRGSSIGDLLERDLARGAALLRTAPGRRTVLVTRRLPLLVALPTAAVAATAWVDLTRLLPAESPWLSLAVVVPMTLAVFVARWIERNHRPAAVLAAADAMAVSCLVATTTLLAPGPRLAVLALIAVQPLLSGPRVRGGVTVWLAWIAAMLAVPAAGALVDLSPEWHGVVLLAAGGGVLVGALLWRRRHDNSAWAPMVVGGSFAMVGWTVAITQGATAAGWACLLLAGITAAVAVLVPLAWASTLSWALGVTAFALLVPIDLDRLPWVWVPVAALMVVAATLLRPTNSEATWTDRWDLPALVVAAGVAVMAMNTSSGVATTAIAATWCGMGALAIGVGVQRRWVAVTVAGAASVVVGSGVAGPGWLALSLFAVSVTAAVATRRSDGAARTTWRITAPIAAVGSWASLLVELDRGATWSSLVSAVLAASLILAVSAALRARRLVRDDVLDVTAAALVVQTVAIVVWGALAGWPDPSGWWLVASVLAVAIGFGLAATPTGWPALRESAAVATLVAAVLAAMTTAPSADATAVTLTFAALGSATGALGVRLAGRAERWQRPLAILAGSWLLVAILVGERASAGVATFAVAACAAIALAAAVATPRGAPRVTAQVVVAASSLATWHHLVVWLEIPDPTWTATSALLGGLGLAGSAAWTRYRSSARDWAATAAGGSAVLLAVAGTARWSEVPGSRTAGLALAAGLLLAATAGGVAAAPLRHAWLRFVAAGLAWTAGAVLIDTFRLSSGQIVSAAATTAMLATLGVVTLSRRPQASPWVPPLELTALLATIVAWASTDMARPNVVATGLLLTGVEMAAVGVSRRARFLVLTSPWVICAAWLVVVASALEGSPVWLTVPMGATLLVTVGLDRWQRRREGRPAAPRLWSILEYLGVAVMVGTPLIQAVTTSLDNALVAVAIGTTVAAWGVLTRVRRRLLAGLVSVALAVLVLVVVPMVDVARRLDGAEIWLALAGIGVVAIVVATLLERGRRVARQSMERLRTLTDDWE
jgi:hypothetical protein